jgi:hypothetical protein
VIGCGDVQVRIDIDGDVVSWSAIHSCSAPVFFDLEPYATEVNRALTDHSWETPERTVSRLIALGVDRERLARSGLRFSWASGRAAPGLMTAALWHEPGPYQVLVRAPWIESDPPAATADGIIRLLARVPSAWADVVWSPQAKDLPVPTIAGNGWRRR